MSEQDPRKRRSPRAFVRPAIIAASATLGLCAAGLAYPLLLGSAPGSAVVASGASPGEEGQGLRSAPGAPSTSAEPSAKPSNGSAASPNGNGASSGSVGSGSSGSTGSGGGAPAPQPPAPAPAPATFCPDSRDQNPSLWDECRAGYVAPSVVYAGAMGCTINNRAAGDYTITLGFRVVGGNYSGYAEVGGITDSSLRFSTHLAGASPGQPVAPGQVAEIAIDSMNGLPGPAIDHITSEPSGMTTVAEACGL